VRDGHRAPERGSIIAEIDGEKHELVGRTTEQIVDLGIALVPEGRRLFPKLTVEENLLLGAFRPKARPTSKPIWTSVLSPSLVSPSAAVSSQAR
jgi:branched-chain amino acid transport system ATP-binding protein